MKSELLLLTRNFYPTIGGVEVYILEFIKFFTAKGRGKIHVLCPKKSALPDELKNGHVYLYSPKSNFTFFEIDHVLTGIKAYFQIIIFFVIFFIQGSGFLLKKNNKIKVIYAVGGIVAIMSALALGRIFGKKIFGHMHADFQFSQFPKLWKDFYKKIFSGLDKVFVNSRDGKIDLEKIGVDKTKIEIIDNWADGSIFELKDKESCRKALKLPLDKKIFLFVGRLSFEKGINEVLDCIEQYRNREDIFFVIIGDGHLKEKVFNCIKDNKQAVYAGSKKTKELVDYYNAADAALWGSIDTYYISITMIEGFHCGLPALCPKGTTNVPKWGKKEFEIKDGVLPDFAGILFESSAKGLSEAIEKFLKMKFDSKKIKEYALMKYSEKNAERIVEEMFS
ncbi:MAG: glycosyltransferase family 4 protein [Candidatus Omnitrophica bacterium]|nr:glycosyltransferase family 4 protein [Candidatus Omnitrophota bacterium]